MSEEIDHDEFSDSSSSLAVVGETKLRRWSLEDNVAEPIFKAQSYKRRSSLAAEHIMSFGHSSGRHSSHLGKLLKSNFWSKSPRRLSKLRPRPHHAAYAVLTLKSGKHKLVSYAVTFNTFNTLSNFFGFFDSLFWIELKWSVGVKGLNVIRVIKRARNLFSCFIKS